jgi:quercetin dioxygenase-like cupin family protein
VSKNAGSVNEPAVSFAAIDPDGDTFQTLRRELGVTSFGINQLTLRARQRLRVHRHERQEEVYLVLEGTLTLIVEGEEHLLDTGKLARVGPESKRQLTNPSDERVVVLALGAYGEHQGRDGIAWPSWDDEGEGRPPQEVPLPEDLPQ